MLLCGMVFVLNKQIFSNYNYNTAIGWAWSWWKTLWIEYALNYERYILINGFEMHTRLCDFFSFSLFYIPLYNFHLILCIAFVSHTASVLCGFLSKMRLRFEYLHFSMPSLSQYISHSNLFSKMLIFFFNFFFVGVVCVHQFCSFELKYVVNILYSALIITRMQTPLCAFEYVR